MLSLRTRSRSGRNAAVLRLQRTQPKCRRSSTVLSDNTHCRLLGFFKRELGFTEPEGGEKDASLLFPVGTGGEFPGRKVGRGRFAASPAETGGEFSCGGRKEIEVYSKGQFQGCFGKG